ncbi:hypothetical protein BpHYR1_015582 [Brachionus plicatilis]|uniref:Uncharacterized protein n=1 Tax=Brachionus plicatilis TaxID=10195 RepID=A0A3M7PZX3_BRAPC|nr:hypothetical protein BpHYR1_015582 [Brachionus plicatilis]
MVDESKFHLKEQVEKTKSEFKQPLPTQNGTKANSTRQKNIQCRSKKRLVKLMIKVEVKSRFRQKKFRRCVITYSYNINSLFYNFGECSHRVKLCICLKHRDRYIQKHAYFTLGEHNGHSFDLEFFFVCENQFFGSNIS